MDLQQDLMDKVKEFQNDLNLQWNTQEHKKEMEDTLRNVFGMLKTDVMV